MGKTASIFIRAVSIGLLALSASCGPSWSGGATSSAGAPGYPKGIVRFKDAGAAAAAGLYKGDSRNCCFLGPRANLLLDKPPGLLRANFRFWVPKVAPYASGETITVTAGGKTASGSTNNDGERWVYISITLPDKYKAETAVPVQIVASKSYSPRKLGLNNDPRIMSVELGRVDFR